MLHREVEGSPEARPLADELREMGNQLSSFGVGKAHRFGDELAPGTKRSGKGRGARSRRFGRDEDVGGRRSRRMQRRHGFHGTVSTAMGSSSFRRGLIHAEDEVDHHRTVCRPQATLFALARGTLSRGGAEPTPTRERSCEGT